MKLYCSMIPSTDKIWNSFRISLGRQIVFGKVWFSGEHHVWALGITFPLRSRFCKCPPDICDMKWEHFNPVSGRLC